MYVRNKIAKTTTKTVIKTALLVALYLALAFYAVPSYKWVKAFVVEKTSTHSKVIIIGETAVTVEVADTDAARIRGLSGRTSLDPGHGMFFVFEKSDLHGIWMKEMNFAIDILWFDQYGELVDVEENARPESYPETFYPKSPSLYVLEVPSGFAREHSLKLGDKIDFY